MAPKTSHDAYNAGWIAAWRENDISALPRPVHPAQPSVQAGCPRKSASDSSATSSMIREPTIWRATMTSPTLTRSASPSVEGELTVSSACGLTRAADLKTGSS